MRKIELTISPDYVPTWTVADAIRELFQNAIDQQTQNPDNKMSFWYSDDTETITISNKSSELTEKTLLLGSTTKNGDEDTIGQFGEGYKIATLVLLRNNKTIVFYNNKSNEIWRPRLVDSRRFGSKILTFFIEKNAGNIIHNNNDDTLVIKVGNISNHEYDNEIIPTNLHLKEYSVFESTIYGDILNNEKGRVYVDGLYVCTYDEYEYGYDFKPKYIKLDRDRKMASDFDLRWLASRMWSVSTHQEAALELVMDNAADISYCSLINSSNSSLLGLSYDKFIEKYGRNAVPVTTQVEMDAVPAGYHGVVIGDKWMEMIMNSGMYAPPKTDHTDPLDELDAWFDDINTKLEDSECTRFKEIFQRLKDKE